MPYARSELNPSGSSSQPSARRSGTQKIVTSE